MSKSKLIRITTIPLSLEKLLENQLSFMKDYYHVIAVSSGEEKLKEFGKIKNVATFFLELTRKITPLKDLIAVLKLYWFLRNEKPLIVHTHTPKAGVIGMVAAYLSRVPIRLHTVAGLPLMETTGAKRILLNFVEKVTYKCATKVYPNSYGLKAVILENKFTESKKLKVLGNGSSNGINTDYFNPNLFSKTFKTTFKEELGINEDDFVFIFVGRLVGDKGINELVYSFNKISKKHKNTKLLLVGALENNLDPLTKITTTTINKNNSIIAVGYQQDVRPYFSISNVLVFPSYREGFPNVVLQAGAMGLPSIVTDINGCNEIIENSVNGYIIPVKNEQALYDKMIIIINESALINPLKGNCRKVIVEKYSQKKMWEAIYKEYQELVNNV